MIACAPKTLVPDKWDRRVRFENADCGESAGQFLIRRKCLGAPALRRPRLSLGYRPLPGARQPMVAVS